MAHVQHKSTERENRTRPDEKTTDANVNKSVSQDSNEADEGGSWQFMLLLGVIALGVVILILKVAGLF